MMRRPILIVLVALAAVPPAAFSAPIYRCAGPNGGTVFSQVPCGKDASQLGPGGNVRPPDAVNDAASAKAALAEIDDRCAARSHKILDDYATRFAGANAKIADLQKRLVVPGPDGAVKDPAVRKQIDAIENRKTELLGEQDRELSTLHAECRTERLVEQRKQAEQDGRATAKR